MDMNAKRTFGRFLSGETPDTKLITDTVDKIVRNLWIDSVSNISMRDIAILSSLACKIDSKIEKFEIQISLKNLQIQWVAKESW